jgi:hypothetical protein
MRVFFVLCSAMEHIYFPELSKYKEYTRKKEKCHLAKSPMVERIEISSF